MNKHIKESILWVLILLPYLYLATLWQQLPDKVPIHFNYEGTADGWSGKTFLLFIPAGLGALIYFIMLVLPLIDPKKVIQQMGTKYTALRFMLTVFFSLLSVYLLYVTKEGNMKNPSLLIALIGILFAMLGNYFQAVRPNYFIGIRTPWTLENEEVWKKTHYLAGRLWMVGGILLSILSFIVNSNMALVIIFISMVVVMVLIPVVFSYVAFKKIKNS
jgi:uncharacterized membrane protein